MKSQTKLFSMFQKNFAKIRNQFHTSIRILCNDNALEYLSAPISTFLSSHGILHQSSYAHTPQQNRVAECKNGHLVETARTLLLHHIVPQRFWGDAILTAFYLINRMPSFVLGNQVPHSLLFPNQPLFCLPPRVFGCTCFVHILTPGQDKLSAKAAKCIFLSYSCLQRVIVATLPIHIDTSFSLMSPFLNTLLSSLPHRLPIPRSYLYLSSFPFRPYPLSPQLLHLDHCRFILVVRIPTLGLLMTHLLWRPLTRRRSCRQPLIIPSPFGKVLVPLVILILFILSYLIIVYPHHILLLFPPCLLFLFLKL